MKLIVVMYHYVRDLVKNRFPQIKGLDTGLFKEQIKFFTDNYNVITMEELLAYYDMKRQIPERSVLLTFDDGYIDHYTTVFPILDYYNVQGSFFVPGKTFIEHKLLDVNKIHFVLASTSIDNLVDDINDQLDYYRGSGYRIENNESLYERYAIEDRFDSRSTMFVKQMLQTSLPEDLRNIISSYLFEKYVGIPEDVFARELYLNIDQIKCMKRNGMFFGIHGYDHYWLGNLHKPEIEKDISMALKSMQGIIDSNAWVMNYPYGSWNEDVIDIIKSKGCKLGFTTEVRTVNLEENNPFKLPRYDTNDFPPKSDNYIKYINDFK